MDNLDQKLNAHYAGRVVRKDLLHRIKKGTNVPSFVLEFLLARYCASDDPEEIEAGIQAVFETLEKNYVRPDEFNKAQSTVQQQGRHKFIDKVHVSYKESEKRHWAEMENFNSRRIAIPEKYYRDNDRLLEGGIWAEVIVAHNDIDEDDYAFYIEDLKPIQLSRFDFAEFTRSRAEFTRDEWLDILIRSIGLEPAQLSQRLKFHFLARLFPLVESNYNFIELGPRGTGKSYVYSEFSPYSTLVSQASTPTLFYNNARHKVGLVGYWDTIAFDEVGRVRLKDPDTVEVMKNYMANGHFSRGVEVIANASFAFVGNIDFAVEQLVNSPKHDLFVSLPKEFDLALLDRFYHYLPGWEIPKNSSGFLTDAYGFITDYLAEAFHHLSKSNRFDYVKKHCRFGTAVEGRDEKGVIKTVAALLKLLHPSGEPAPAELEEYMAFALEGRRRVKEQLNKRKPDDEYARINLSYIKETGEEIVVWCPESRNAQATQEPVRRRLDVAKESSNSARHNTPEPAEGGQYTEFNMPQPALPAEAEERSPEEQHFTIYYGEKGYSYERIFGPYLKGAKQIQIDDPYIRMPHQIQNLVRFCEMVVRDSRANQIELVTGFDLEFQKEAIAEKLAKLQSSLAENGVKFTFSFSDTLHDREVVFDNGWTISIGRGLDFYQKPEDWYSIGSVDLDLRPCLETKVHIFRA